MHLVTFALAGGIDTTANQHSAFLSGVYISIWVFTAGILMPVLGHFLNQRRYTFWVVAVLHHSNFLLATPKGSQTAADSVNMIEANNVILSSPHHRLRLTMGNTIGSESNLTIDKVVAPFHAERGKAELNKPHLLGKQ